MNSAAAMMLLFTDKFGNRAKLDDDFNDTWFEYGAGVAFQGSKNNYFLSGCGTQCRQRL